MPKEASALFLSRKRPSRLSPFIYMTDPDRGLEPEKAAETLPEGAAIIYRHFGANNRNEISGALRQITFNRGLQFLIGDDPELAVSSGADGVHFRRDAKLQAPILWRRRCPDWLISMAGLKHTQSYSGDLSCLDGLIVSPVFPSDSVSAGDPLGTNAFSNVCQTLPVPVFALGGINEQTVPELLGSGAAGLAGVSGLI